VRPRRRRESLYEPLTLRRALGYLLAGLAVFALLLNLFRAIDARRQGYAWRQMDWNGDGRTSLREFLHASDVGTRPIRQGGRVCVEFFELRDGRVRRVECPSE
jgi:hypothetical protein